MLQNTLAKLLDSKEAKIIYQDKAFTAKQIYLRTINIIETLKTSHDLTKPLALCLPNSPELVCWQLACFHLGIVIVPIIYEQSPEHIQQVLKLTKPETLLITTEKNKKLIKPECKIDIIDDQCGAVSRSYQKNTFDSVSTVSSDQLAMIIFSSGSTGQMKGIQHTYQSAYGFIQLLTNVLDAISHMIYLVAQPMGHIGGIVTTLLTLLNEGTVVLLEEFEITRYLSMAVRYQPTHVNLHTPLFYEIINYPKVNKDAFARVQSCFAGGDDIPRELPAQFTEKTGAKMRIGYGMTEIGIVTVNKDPYEKYSGSSGKKVSQALIEIRKIQDGTLAKTDEVGEIWAQSPACCTGYWDMPELNEKTLVNGWFRTGDLAYQDSDGYYWYKGRANQVICRGNELIYPEEIEQALFDSPDVKSAAVIGLNDQMEGEVPIAFVELKNPADNTKEIHDKIMQHVTKHLQKWQVPVEIKVIEKMPLNMTGKIDRNALKAYQ